MINIKTNKDLLDSIVNIRNQLPNESIYRCVIIL